MREQSRDKERLEHILSAIAIIDEGLANYSKEELLTNHLLYYGLVKQLEIIGEAANLLTHEFRESHKEVDWRPIVNMRNVLVHDYIHISQEILWDTITNNIPELKFHIVAYHQLLETMPFHK